MGAVSGITIAQLFYDAYRDAGVEMLTQSGLSPDQTEEARTQFNRTVDSMQLDSTMVSHVARLQFQLIQNKGDYTVGPGGDWDPGNPVSASSPGFNYPSASIASNYPVRIERASILLTSQFTGTNFPGPPPLPPPSGPGPAEYPLFKMSEQEWQGWTLKNQTTNFPRAYYYEQSYPLGVFHLLYVPYDTDTCVLYIEETLAQIDSDSDAILYFRPGYQDLLTTKLAIKIARRTSGIQVTPELMSAEREAEELVRTNNHRPLKKMSDANPRIPFRSNIYIGNRYGQS